MHELQALLVTVECGVTRQTLSRRTQMGRLIRLFRGVYVDAEAYRGLSHDDQYRLQALAYLAVHPKLSAWGVTAAALLGAPVLRSAKLHFQGEGPVNCVRVRGVVIHQALAGAAQASQEARIIYECAASSPLAEALMAADFLARGLPSAWSGSGLSATRWIGDGRAGALVRSPIDANARVEAFKPTAGAKKLSPESSSFASHYRELRQAGFAAEQAELLWHDYAALCVAVGRRRGFRRAIWAGLFFSDLPESPAESLVVARCVELGLPPLYLQVSIRHPESGQVLGRVDGLWPTGETQQHLRYANTRHGRRLFLDVHSDDGSLIIEFDGREKYGDNIKEVWERERMRQNAISNLGFRFVRVSWEDLMDPMRLDMIVTRANPPRLSS